MSPHALKGQKLLAQGNALGIKAINKAQGQKPYVYLGVFKAFALTGRWFVYHNTQGVALG